jgi:xanthine/uracil permease
MGQMFGAIIVLGIAYTVYKLFELYARRQERMTMIEKMGFGDGTAVPPDFAKWFSPPPTLPTSWALRLGLLLTGLGLGLVTAVITNHCLEFLRYEKDILYVASMMLFGGLGLLIAYLIEQKNQKKVDITDAAAATGH